MKAKSKQKILRESLERMAMFEATTGVKFTDLKLQAERDLKRIDEKKREQFRRRDTK